ncbi:unnamed protein product [Lepeophtheirus salmonis]|uniref:(salmon louse) hypothetical protein n=1 Tax=Lepeophtheirus salmonis TaxID=72036 RepID=A0A7R8CFJ5_LEPSM|nr:unnamed protein product [Lepeophtheirus salmonis]CAF2807075.1 unnamed protein product [Lepeophtheirus salmonis]
MLLVPSFLFLLVGSSSGLPEGRSSFPSTGYEDFVGFSYSRALLPPSSSFVHFLNENTNINADFVPKYGSFRVTQPGIYGFSFSFSAHPEMGLSEVALLKDSIPVVSAVGDKFGVSRFIMIPLTAGSVIQLQVLRGVLSEDGQSVSTTFSGWLLSSPTATRRAPDPCYCTPPLPGRTPSPPISSHYPITKPPALFHPSYTQRPPLHSYHTPSSSPPSQSGLLGRSPSSNCCISLYLSSGSDKRVRNSQAEKLGRYNILYKDSVGRSVYKHSQNERVYLYYFSRSNTNWKGWMIGPSPGGVMGGILAENEEFCPTHSGKWYYYTSGKFLQSSELHLSCEEETGDEILDIGRSKGRSGESFFENLHKHTHVHYHNHHGSSQNGNVMLPFYSIKADPNVVTATFVYANNNGSLNTEYIPFHHLTGNSPIVKSSNSDDHQ